MSSFSFNHWNIWAGRQQSMTNMAINSHQQSVNVTWAVCVCVCVLTKTQSYDTVLLNWLMTSHVNSHRPSDCPAAPTSLHCKFPNTKFTIIVFKLGAKKVRIKKKILWKKNQNNNKIIQIKSRPVNDSSNVSSIWFNSLFAWRIYSALRQTVYLNWTEYTAGNYTEVFGLIIWIILVWALYMKQQPTQMICTSDS